MNNSQKPISQKLINLLSRIKISPGFQLIIFILGICLVFDNLTNKNLLTLPFLSSTISAYILTNWAIQKLKDLNYQQTIREDGPQAHHIKSGTPTMGGLLIIPIGLIIGNLANINSPNRDQLISVSMLTLAFMFIGAIDDWISLKRKRNAGLTAKLKLALQGITTTIFLIWIGIQGWISSDIFLTKGNYLAMGLLIWPIALFVVLAESNATNLTDGLDGLASGCGALVFTGLALNIMLRNNNSDIGFASFSIALSGSWLGFLLHNQKPAKLFMGDTGSLAMGAGLSGVALLTNSLWTLLIMGGIFLIESLSVIIQVFTYKITKKINGQGYRVFKMAPFHHHFELIGYKEEAIVKYFWIATIILVFLGLKLTLHR